MAIERNLPFDEYLALPGINASLLASCLGSWADFKWQQDNGYYVPDKVVAVGTALHLVVQHLPDCVFEDFYAVMPPFHLDPENVTSGKNPKPSTSTSTSYYKDRCLEFVEESQRAGKKVLTEREYARLERCVAGLLKNREAVDIIAHSQRELVATATIGSIPCKGRIDGVHSGLQWDLKSTNRLDERSFSSVANSKHYYFKDAFRMMLLSENGVNISEFRYIVVLDENVSEKGSANHAPDSTFCNVPLPAMEQFMDKARDCLRELEYHQGENKWPGVDPFEAHIWGSEMGLTLVD